MNTSEVLAQVAQERQRQIDKWGPQNHAPIEWLAILMEEVGEASKEGLEAHFTKFYADGSYKQMRHELIQVAAVAVAMIESLDRNQLKDADLS